MKKIIPFIMTGLALSLSCFTSCKSTEEVEKGSDENYVQVNISEIENQNPDYVDYTLRTPGEISGKSVQEYSHRTLIVSLEEGVKSEDVDQLAADFNLSVVYKYSIVNACALSADHDLTDEELDELILKLEKDERVLSAAKDYVYHLDPVEMPVTE